MDLSTPEHAFTMLRGITCGEDLPGQPLASFVRPFDPDASQLVHLLRGEDTLLMPPDRPLPDVEIAMIERWILDGATCD